MAPPTSTRSLLAFSCVFALASAHALIMDATCGQGVSNSFGLLQEIPRDSDSPELAQVDSSIIRTAEAEANIDNKCGRTQLGGNLDVAKETENALATNITQCDAGGTIKFTLHMVNTDGGGPYSCDLDETNNGGQFVKKLEVTQNAPGTNGLNPDAPKGENFPMTVELPKDMDCKGGTTGNVCTLRCRNPSVAGPFGGCIAIQQGGGGGGGGQGGGNGGGNGGGGGGGQQQDGVQQQSNGRKQANNQQQRGGGRGARLVRRQEAKKGKGKGGKGGGAQTQAQEADQGGARGGGGGGGGNNNNKNGGGGGGGGVNAKEGISLVDPDQIRTKDDPAVINQLQADLQKSVPIALKALQEQGGGGGKVDLNLGGGGNQKQENQQQQNDQGAGGADGGGGNQKQENKQQQKGGDVNSKSTGGDKRKSKNQRRAHL